MKTAINDGTVSTKQSVFVYTIIFLSLMVGWLTQKPSDQAYMSDEPTQFSQTRALSLLKEISTHPHYTTSEHHSEVRDIILAELKDMGLNVSVQNTLAVSSKLFRSNEVSNIIAVLPATSNENPERKALALVSHYDSRTHSSLGASDAGSGVVTIIESLRAYIATEQQRQNDIVVVITDAEEQGLMGAEAFVKESPLAKNIGLVLNFEARGSGGPAYMFMETNHGNKALIRAFKAARVDYPQTNSLMYSIYKMLPNDTDLTVFKEQGDIQGFNFAFIDDHYDYHTIQDNVERLDRSTLNHQASYLTAILPIFANMDLASLYNDVDQVYFNVANLGIVDYPFSWVLPTVILATLIFVALISIALKRYQISIKQVLLGFIPALVSLFAVAITSLYGWQGAAYLFPYLTEMPHGFTYNGHWIIAFTILLSLLLTLTIYRAFNRRFSSISTIELLVGPVVIWLMINALIATYLVGAGFFIVVLFAPLLLLSLFVWDPDKYAKLLWLVALFISIGVLIVAPQIPVFVIGLGLSNLIIAAIITSLLLILAIPILLKLKGQFALNMILSVALVFSITGIVVKSGYDENNKKPNNINYVYDTETKQAYLFSYTKQLDTFTQQFFDQQDTDSQHLKDIYPINRWRFPYYTKPIQSIDLSPAGYNANIMNIDDEEHHYQLDITLTPNRPLNMLQLTSSQPLMINKMSIEGKLIAKANKQTRPGFIFSHLVTNDMPISVSIQFESRVTPEFRLIETSFDLTSQLENFQPRPASYMPSPFRQTDTVIISQPIVMSYEEDL